LIVKAMKSAPQKVNHGTLLNTKAIKSVPHCKSNGKYPAAVGHGMNFTITKGEIRCSRKVRISFGQILIYFTRVTQS